MENSHLLREMAEIANGDLVPHHKFSYKHHLLKKNRKVREKIDYSNLSVFELFELKKYDAEIAEILKKRSFFEIIAYFQSTPILKDKLYYWNPKKEINDPLTFIISIYHENVLLEKLKAAKIKSLIFYLKGFTNFEQMIERRINLNDLKVLENDLLYFKKHWITKKGKTLNFNKYLEKFDHIKVKNNRKTIDVEQRVITHPFWCDDLCQTDWHFVKIPTSKSLEFCGVSCTSYFEIEIHERMYSISFNQFKGLVEKDKNYEQFWAKLGVKYDEEIELV